MIRAAALLALLLSTAAAAKTDPQAAAAFRAAFGKSRTVIATSSNDIREKVRYMPGRLVETPFGPVLISPGEVINPAHVSSGKIAAVYLKRTPRGFAVAKRFVPAMETGSFGQIGSWSVSRAYGAFPTVAVEGGGIFQGYLCSVLTLLELAPDRPKELVTVPMSYDYSGAVGDDRKTEIKGRIARIVSGRSFDVVYSGSKNFTERYVRRSNSYMLAGGGESHMERC